MVMIESDKAEFKILMVGVGELYNKEITKPLMRIYFSSLINYSLGEVEKGISAHTMDAKHGSFFPKPADIVRHLQSGDISTENKAELAWAQVVREIRVTGSYGRLKLDDKQALASIKALGSWKQLCASTVDEMTWKKKEFISMYETYENTPINMLPSSLPGRIALVEHKKEQSNSMKNILNGVSNYRK
tara:strand:+ start:80 stop:643 length:564 start_codon:yes stop_codon:yes gene_type:complete